MTSLVLHLAIGTFNVIRISYQNVVLECQWSNLADKKLHDQGEPVFF
jgi:hypothetical protein